MGWYKDINAILEQEPETWLAYLHGQQLNNIPHLTRTQPRYRGLVLQLAKVLLNWLKHFHFRQPKGSHQTAKFLVFSGSLNQRNSLASTIINLRERGAAIVAVAPESFIRGQANTEQYVPLTYSLLDVCKALLLMACRGPSLYREMKNIHPVAMGWHFSTFCSAYAYLVRFHRALKQQKPEFVITANDHNVPNRCLLAVAHHLGVKTVYLQHASVSNLFPALRVNYAFLDGQCALDTYRECEKNQPNSQRKVPLPQVLLTGQKKHLTRKDSAQIKTIGLALNSLDNATAAVQLVTALASAGQKLRIRWHPGQAVRDVKWYMTAFDDMPQVALSDPKKESVSEFMAQIGWLVAGNSSIHLEAALAGVAPIYYELTLPDSSDYYGYVQHGLAAPASSPAGILGIVNNTAGTQGPDVDAVRYYSATYLTEWDGREGELVAECLINLSSGGGLPVDVLELIAELDPGLKLELPKHVECN